MSRAGDAPDADPRETARIELSAGAGTDAGELLVLDEVRPDLLGELRTAILSREARPSSPTLNQGGWRSDDVFLWGEPSADELAAEILSIPEIADLIRGPRARAVSSGCLSGWAMINRAGSHHPRHVHRGATLTGVYYVDPGDADAPTLFEAPGREIVVDAAPGRIALFPGGTWHRVRPYAGSRPRITIAFDVRREAR